MSRGGLQVNVRSKKCFKIKIPQAFICLFMCSIMTLLLLKISPRLWPDLLRIRKSGAFGRSSLMSVKLSNSPSKKRGTVSLIQYSSHSVKAWRTSLPIPFLRAKKFTVVCWIQSTWAILVSPWRKHSSWNGALCFMDCILMTDDIFSDTSKDDL